MNIRIITGIVILGSINFGCTGTKVHFTDAPLDKLDLSRGHKVTAQASGFQLFYLIPIGINERQTVAYERLQENALEDCLTNIKVQDSWKWAVIGDKYITKLTATAYPYKTASSTPTPQNLTQKLEELKGLHDKGALTDTEYEVARKKTLGN